jgi:hypothetical protein
MPAWLSRLSRRGEPEARTSLGRPSMRDSSGEEDSGADARGTYRKGLHSTTGEQVIDAALILVSSL